MRTEAETSHESVTEGILGIVSLHQKLGKRGKTESVSELPEGTNTLISDLGL